MIRSVLSSLEFQIMYIHQISNVVIDALANLKIGMLNQVRIDI